MTYICCVKYKYKKKKANKGAAVKGPDKEPLTKKSNLADTKKRFAKEFPDVTIPENALRTYAMVYLLSGRTEDAMQQMIEKERKRQKNESGS